MVISTNQNLDLEPKERTVLYTATVFDNVVVREMYISWEGAIAKQGKYNVSSLSYDLFLGVRSPTQYSHVGKIELELG